MEKIVFLPLDERPCNYNYPKMLKNKSYSLVMPDLSLLSRNKIPCDLGRLKEWAIRETKDASILALSMDTLIYGGIVPSRLNNDDIETLHERSNILLEIRKNNPKIKILAFELIMRCPSYSSSDEEPDYYENYGYEIHMLGEYTQKERLGIISDEEKALKEKYLAKIKKEDLSDYLSRRERNLNVLLGNLDLVRKNVIDFFIIPQDDTSVYGYTTMDKEVAFKYVRDNSLDDRVAIYPGADDTGLTLLSRALTIFKGKGPRIYVDYASTGGENTIPCFEDQRVDKTIGFQISSAGCERTYDYNLADIVLFINVGSIMSDYKERTRYEKEYFQDRDLEGFADRIEKSISDCKIAAIADIAYPNGADPDFIRMMEKRNLLLKVGSYAGWNTSSNTLGTTISFAVNYMFDRDEKSRMEFLSLRYLEDYGYMAMVRGNVTENDLPSLGLNYFDLKDKNDIVSSIIKDKILTAAKNDLGSVYAIIESIDVHQPWNRMFETDINVRLK